MAAARCLIDSRVGGIADNVLDSDNLAGDRVGVDEPVAGVDECIADVVDQVKRS